MIEARALKKRFATLHHWYRESFEELTLRSSVGVSLRMALRCPQGSRGTLVFVSGRTEFIEKYLEVCRDLSDLQLSICLYDHCGQGGSGRLLADPQKGHIDRFDTYVTDLKRVIDHLNAAGCPAPVFLVGHSMGSTISALFALHYPERIDKLLLCSPMFAIQTGVMLPDFLVRIVAASACRFGLGSRYTPTTGPYNPVREFHGNVLTSDRFRFEYNAYMAANLDFAALGGPTIGWLNEAFKAMNKLQHRADLITKPLLILVAAGDRVIDAGAADRFAAASSKCSYQKYLDSGHELLMERDEVRNDVLKRIELFLAG
jgi:lysophospholipase